MVAAVWTTPGLVNTSTSPLGQLQFMEVEHTTAVPVGSSGGPVALPLLHIPTPGDHYSPSTGSATMTVIYELSRQHTKRGGDTVIVVSSGTRHDYDVGRAIETGYSGALPSRKQVMSDALLGRFGAPRIATLRAFAPAVHAIPEDFDGHALLHNAVAPVRSVAQSQPGVRPTIYAHNDLFRTYSSTELRRSIASCHRVVCVSQFIADRLQERAGGSVDNVRVVLNGVDVARFTPTLNREPTSEPLILFVGQVTPHKAPDLLIRAAVRLGSRFPFRLRIVGSSGFSSDGSLSDYERELRRLAAPLGDRVEFKRFIGRSDISFEYQQGDIFVVPSNWDDPCPLTVLEGLSCGLPIICSRRGGIPEEGADAVTYFDPPDVDGLAERLEWLISDENARLAFGERARQRAMELSWEHQYECLVGALVG